MTDTIIAPPIFNIGDLAVANDGSGDRYCVFLRREGQGWMVFSFEMCKHVYLSDETVSTLTKMWNFRVVQSGYDISTLQVTP